MITQQQIAKIIQNKDTVLSFLYNEFNKPNEDNILFKQIKKKYFNDDDVKLSPNFKMENLVSHLIEGVNSFNRVVFSVTASIGKSSTNITFYIDADGYNPLTQMDVVDYLTSRLNQSNYVVCKIQCVSVNKVMFSTNLRLLLEN